MAAKRRRKADERNEEIVDKAASAPRWMSAHDLLDSGLVGMWADREDIGDGVEFTRELREKAQRRQL